jgi:hypothetical protein
MIPLYTQPDKRGAVQSYFTFKRCLSILLHSNYNLYLESWLLYNKGVTDFILSTVFKEPGAIAMSRFLKSREHLMKLLGFLLLLGLVTCNNSNNSGIISSWVQAGPGGITIARIITQRDNCPEIRLNGAFVQMVVRHSPDNDFPVLVCEIIIPQGTITASVGGRALKLPVENPERLIVIADTGCRLETGDVPQSCNDPQA